MNSLKILQSANDIDLNRHGVIEAHAGTGKTYTIVKMVLRILQEPAEDAKGRQVYNHIRDLLLMTYTEKAAGELKKRIREGIETRIIELEKNGPGVNVVMQRHLEDCLNNFHESFIGTIHGVCLRLLRTWPFETGVSFATETVDDGEGIVSALRESMRTDWQKDGTLIPWALERLQAQGTQLEEEHFGLVADLAVKLLDGENTVLDRRSCGGYTLGGLRDRLDGVTREINNGESIAGFRKTVVSLVDALKQAAASGTMKPDRAAMLETRTAQLQAMCQSDRYDAKILGAPCSFGRSKLFTQPDYGKVPGIERIDDLCRSIAGHPYLALLGKSSEIAGVLLLTLLGDAALLLRDRWTGLKQEQGLISFQDMLRLMHRAVTGNPKFCSLLCRRLRYGIIDEFQDTSILQWQIFKRIFLETSGDDGPRLFIVGDPKQSIYAFQGADVQSYLDAKNAIAKAGGQVYGLIKNYRSLPETVDGYNAIIAKEGNGPDWFAFDDAAANGSKISYPSGGEGGAIARVPEDRAEKPGNRLPAEAVQVMVLEGNTAARRNKMAEWASRVIRALKGKTISVPDGLGWKNDLTLDYNDFAVIVENNRLAEPFLERFQSDGIPAVKYKMTGVFQSAMARDLHALLRAILHPAGGPAPRLAALLTRFFNRDPAGLDPEKDLEPCAGNGKNCACISHALEEWTFLASNHLWSRLFKSIQDRTRVRELLITMADGKRGLADLRQVIDYATEKLYRGNYGLEQLVEHLARLLYGEENVDQDENLYVLATDKSCVKVLTMHAAKGLEFPVVFAATGGSGRKGKGMGALCWIADDFKKHLMPMESVKEAGDDFRRLFEKEMKRTTSWDVIKGKEKNAVPHLGINEEILSPPDAQMLQERRRQFYVALTRAQAMLFVPAHLKRPGPESGPVAWSARALPPHPDRDLTPRLLHLLDENAVALFDGSLPVWNNSPSVPVKELEGRLDGAEVTPEPAGNASGKIEKLIASLELPSLVSRQTSYTELSRKATVDRAFDRSEEPDGPENEVREKENLRRPDLPGGRHTGDALHCALEKILLKDNIKSFVNNDGGMRELVQEYLEQNNVLDKTDETKRSRAIDAALNCLKGGLSTPLPLPAGETVSIAGLEKRDRIPEMEFQLGVAPHWVHGYMDLVFRIGNKAALRHPWRYFVLDWKSDRLDAFDAQTIDDCIKERHYDLQSKIYCHALDSYLKGLLGDKYDPEQNLGSAVYVFLRSFQDTPEDTPKDVCHTWTRPADPEEDAKFTVDQINKLVRKNVE